MKTRKSTPETPRQPQKDASPSRPATEATATAVHQAALATMAYGIDCIWQAIDDIRTGKVTPTQRDAGSVVATLTQKVVTFYEATRKAEAARLKRIAGIDPGLVLQWFRQLDTNGRDHIVREMLAISERKSGLG